MDLYYIANVRIPTEKAHGHQIMKMCSEFAKLSDDKVKLILPARRNSLMADPFTYYGLKKNFELLFLKSFDPAFLLGKGSGWYIKAQASLFMAALFFYLLFNRQKNAVYYTRDELFLPLLSLFSKNIYWEAHAIPSERSLQRLGSALRRCRKIFVVTQQIKERLVEFGLSSEKIEVVPSGVDLEKYSLTLNQGEARKIVDLPTAKTILGYTGSFKTKDMDKGIKDILLVLKNLKDKYDIMFVAVGGSAEDIDFYQKQVENLGLADIVRLLPKVNQDKLAIYQKAFDILLMPFPYGEHYAYYMSPLKMFEYMCSGRPIIASDLPSVRDVLNENNCFFCRPDDPDNLAEKIELVLRNDDLAVKISQQALMDVRNYTWEQRAKNILKFIN